MNYLKDSSGAISTEFGFQIDYSQLDGYKRKHAGRFNPATTIAIDIYRSWSVSIIRSSLRKNKKYG